MSPNNFTVKDTMRAVGRELQVSSNVFVNLMEGTQQDIDFLLIIKVRFVELIFCVRLSLICLNNSLKKIKLLTVKGKYKLS